MPFIHIVLVKVKDSIVNDAAAFTELKQNCNQLAQLEVVKKTAPQIAWGPPVYPERANGHNWGLYTTFESKEKYEEYAQDEGHKSWAKTKLFPNTDGKSLFYNLICGSG